MAPEGKDRKRKAAPAVVNVTADPPSKKTKKGSAKAVDSAAEKPSAPTTRARTRSTKAIEVQQSETKKVSAVDEPTNNPTSTKTKFRKRAVDFLGDAKETEGGVPVIPIVEAEAITKPAKGDSKTKKRKSDSKAVDGNEEAVVVEEVAAPLTEDESEVDLLEEDDQTAALLKGFESEGDDEDISGDEGFNNGQDLPSIPDYKKTNKRLKNAAKSSTEHTPGVVYVGRIPHGFYENEMRAYFTQFGTITRLRLSRNRRTGKSKHYAFIEFASAAVAKIVADTMDNYLMFGHILKCKFVPAEHLHAEIWKGANRRFKKTPWNKIERSNLVQGKTREQWDKRVEKEQEKRKAKADKLKEIGYEFNLPQLKNVSTVPVQEPAGEAASGTEIKDIAPATDAAAEAFLDTLEATVAAASGPKKSTKEKKVKVTTTEETNSDPVEKPVQKVKASQKSIKDGVEITSTVSVKAKKEPKKSKKVSK